MARGISLKQGLAIVSSSGTPFFCPKGPNHICLSRFDCDRRADAAFLAVAFLLVSEVNILPLPVVADADVHHSLTEHHGRPDHVRTFSRIQLIFRKGMHCIAPLDPYRQRSPVLCINTYRRSNIPVSQSQHRSWGATTRVLLVPP